MIRNIRQVFPISFSKNICYQTAEFILTGFDIPASRNQIYVIISKTKKENKKSNTNK